MHFKVEGTIVETFPEMEICQKLCPMAGGDYCIHDRLEGKCECYLKGKCKLYTLKWLIGFENIF